MCVGHCSGALEVGSHVGNLRWFVIFLKIHAVCKTCL